MSPISFNRLIWNLARSLMVAEIDYNWHPNAVSYKPATWRFAASRCEHRLPFKSMMQCRYGLIYGRPKGPKGNINSKGYSLNVNEWKFHSPKEWNSCKPLKKEWFCTLNSKFPLIWSENDSKKSEFPLVWGVERRTILFRVVLRLTPQMSGNSLFLEWFSLFMSGNLLFNVQNHSFLSGLQEFHSIGEWNFHSFTFREYINSKRSNTHS